MLTSRYGTKLVGILVFAIVGTGCSADPVASQCQPASIEAGLMADIEADAADFLAEDRRWHLSLDTILATAPRDSLVSVAFQLRATQQQFAELVAERGGTVTYFFQTFNAVTVRIPVGSLASLIMDHPDTFLWISGGRIPVPTLRSDCG